MSVLTYNGITLPYGLTTDYNQSAVYDDVSGTDRIYTRYEITYQGLINVSYLGIIFPSLELDTDVANNPAAIMNSIRTLLLKPRQAFSFTINGINLLPALQGVGTVDARNGPQPQYCKVMELNSTTFLLSYRIVAHYWEDGSSISTDGEGPTGTDVGSGSSSPGGKGGGKLVNNQVPATGNAVLTNRWTESVEIDNCNYSTRTREGTIIIRSDNDVGLLADQLRSQMAVVGVPKGFLRRRARYAVDPSGLALRYAVTDEECFLKPPEPAFEAEGEYIEESTEFGCLTYGEVRVRLAGAKDTPRDQLITAAVNVAHQKIRKRGLGLGINQNFGQLSIPGIPERGRLRLDLYRNEVEFYMRVMYVPPVDSNLGAFASFVNGRGQPNTTYLTDTPLSPPPPADTYTPPYTDRGTAGFLLRAAAYYDASIINSTIQTIQGSPQSNPQTRTDTAGDQLTQGTEVGRAGKFGETSLDANG